MNQEGPVISVSIPLAPLSPRLPLPSISHTFSFVAAFPASVEQELHSNGPS